MNMNGQSVQSAVHCTKHCGCVRDFYVAASRWMWWNF